MPPPFKSKQAADVQNFANLVKAGISWKTICIYTGYVEKLIGKLLVAQDRARADGLLAKIQAYRDLHMADQDRVKAQLSTEIEKLAELFEEGL